MHRRATSAIVLSSVACALLVACATQQGDGGSSSVPSYEGGGEDDVFPVTLEHAFGEVTIEESPERVVALGATDADVILALGVVPVANSGYTFYEDGLGPWARDLVGDEERVRIESEAGPSFEQLAALEPDLIVAVSAGLGDDDYERLAQIAPTLARPAGTADYQVSRAEATDFIATAMGRPEQGRQLSEEVDALLARTIEEHPEFTGRTGTVVLPSDDGYYAFLPGDARGQFLESLGFELPEAVAELDDGESFFVDISAEQVDRLDGDLLISLSDDPEHDITEDGELITRLDVARNNAIINATMDQRGAISYNTVLSIPYAIEELVPQMAAALE
ncbi:iron-siderophore ABC transporter substrate-binding protein [Microbacterium gubbeenense]|uniref:iron-siderophore ABC transporter substrate-binding protein n=1 Tax=Microbacterium gubbeenense TaxID=159896 RepID=UPI00048D7593|nr:iron-siderophore ABC transporter substrate-binding protein [Microbacterium gubbeenense]